MRFARGGVSWFPVVLCCLTFTWQRLRTLIRTVVVQWYTQTGVPEVTE